MDLEWRREWVIWRESGLAGGCCLGCGFGPRRKVCEKTADRKVSDEAKEALAAAVAAWKVEGAAVDGEIEKRTKEGEASEDLLRRLFWQRPLLYCRRYRYFPPEPANHYWRLLPNSLPLRRP